jgi:hypothetical protein
MSYCTKEEVNNLFGDISDDISDEMFETVIQNSTAWVNSNLKRHYVPLPTESVPALRTVSIYHAASDILLSLYHGEELPVQYDIWFQKAQDLLDAYIDEYLNSEAQVDELDKIQRVKHSHARTYNQKRGRGRRWAR